MNKRSIALIGVVLFIIPLGFFLLWVYACDQTNRYPDNVLLYNNYLPGFLKGRYTTSVLSFFCCALTLFLNARNLNDMNRRMKIISWVAVIASGLLGFLNLFSMM